MTVRASPHGGSSCRGAWAPDEQAACAACRLGSCSSRALEHGLSSCGTRVELLQSLVSPGQGSNPRVPCTGRWPLHHGASREALVKRWGPSSLCSVPPAPPAPGQFTSSMGPDPLRALSPHKNVALPKGQLQALFFALGQAGKAQKYRVQPWDFILYLESFGGRFT